MRLWHGIAAMCFLMLVAAWLVDRGKLHAEVFAVPVVAFGAWLIRQPKEMRKPKVKPPLPAVKLWSREEDEEVTKP